jgi:hypothetical protein
MAARVNNCSDDPETNLNGSGLSRSLLMLINLSAQIGSLVEKAKYVYVCSRACVCRGAIDNRKLILLCLEYMLFIAFH